MSDNNGGGGGCACGCIFWAVLAWFICGAICCGLPTPWGLLSLDLVPPGIYLEPPEAPAVAPEGPATAPPATAVVEPAPTRNELNEPADTADGE